RLATKTRKAVGGDVGKGSCHSDHVDPTTAQALQGRLVSIRRKDERPVAD
ncbi:MAG: hypothetical protein FJ096_19960, partial [Deltaproteobacteria bacterium]|nr:hypothetical protein [Deltaproteobacteria bacterium]